MVKPPRKSLKCRLQRICGLGEIPPCTRRMLSPNFTETEVPVLGTLPDLTLCTSSVCASVFFYGKLIIIFEFHELSQ